MTHSVPTSANDLQAKPAKRQYAAVAKAISQFEPVTMWADPSVAEEAKQYLADAPNVTVKVSGVADAVLQGGYRAHSAVVHCQCSLFVTLYSATFRGAVQ